ncbi:hypothetical protein, partial [Allochromatium palmeri]|uniref:hypothetical protein n=1 Tax=Allochromatium palmeri TaxID=231048 RepID=UPI001CA445BF
QEPFTAGLVLRLRGAFLGHRRQAEGGGEHRAQGYHSDPFAKTELFSVSLMRLYSDELPLKRRRVLYQKVSSRVREAFQSRRVVEFAVPVVDRLQPTGWHFGLWTKTRSFPVPSRPS